VTDNIDLIRKHFPDIAAQLDSLKQGSEMLAQENDARATAEMQAELDRRQKLAAEDARLDRLYKDNGRDRMVDSGATPRVGVKTGKNPATGETVFKSVWSDLYSDTLAAMKREERGGK
jgi:hypothetical protein